MEDLGPGLTEHHRPRHPLRRKRRGWRHDDWLVYLTIRPREPARAHRDQNTDFGQRMSSRTTQGTRSARTPPRTAIKRYPTSTNINRQDGGSNVQ
jgi:hypothetical protein